MTKVKPPMGKVLKMMFKDPVTIAGIVLPVLICWLIVGSMPRNYPSIGSIYLYSAILIAFSLFAQFRNTSIRIRVQMRTEEVEKMVGDLNNLIKKTKNPVAFKREQEKGEFQ